MNRFIYQSFRNNSIIDIEIYYSPASISEKGIGTSCKEKIRVKETAHLKLKVLRYISFSI